VETLRYTVSFGCNSTQNSPRSANPPNYPAHIEHRHLPSHRAARYAR
jgi:hypothetical protein